MIIGSWTLYKVGDTIQDDYKYKQDKVIQAAFFILRRATYQEWLDYRINEGDYVYFKNEEKAYFYEVLTD